MLASERMVGGAGACMEEGLKVPMGHVGFEILERHRGENVQEAAADESLEGFLESGSQDQEEDRLG